MSMRDAAYQIENTFVTSSPKWLSTFTAILPVGRSKGREISLYGVSQTASE
jgi:hypothetical protein